MQLHLIIIMSNMVIRICCYMLHGTYTRGSQGHLQGQGQNWSRSNRTSLSKCHCDCETKVKQIIVIELGPRNSDRITSIATQAFHSSSVPTWRPVNVLFNITVSCQWPNVKLTCLSVDKTAAKLARWTDDNEVVPDCISLLLPRLPKLPS